MATPDARLAVPAAPGSRLLEAILPMLRAFLWAVSGFVAAAWLTALVAGAELTAEMPVTIGYVFAIAGGEEGGGGGEGRGGPWCGRTTKGDGVEGIGRYGRVVTVHQVIGLHSLRVGNNGGGRVGLM